MGRGGNQDPVSNCTAITASTSVITMGLLGGTIDFVYPLLPTTTITTTTTTIIMEPYPCGVTRIKVTQRAICHQSNPILMKEITELILREIGVALDLPSSAIGETDSG